VVSGGRHDQSATKAQHPPPTSSASAPAVAKLASGSSVGHKQEASAKKGSSDSEPALTQTTSHDAGRGQIEVRSGSVDTNPLCCLVVFRFVCLVLRVNFCFSFVRIVQALRVVLLIQLHVDYHSGAQSEAVSQPAAFLLAWQSMCCQSVSLLVCRSL